VVRRRARMLGCPVWELGKDYGWRPGGRETFTVELPGVSIDGIRLGMAGEFQRDNAAVALAAAWRWADGEGIAPGTYAAEASRAVSDARWPGRLCPLPVRRNARAWVDGGHNPDAARALARAIAGFPPWGRGKRLIALWSMLADKDAPGYLRAVASRFDGLVTYPLRHDRAANVDALEECCRREGIPVRTASGFREGWRAARRWAGKDGVVLVCGSLAGAGEAYRNLAGGVP